MRRGSFASGVLSEIGNDDVTRMLDLDESLFVEHKRGFDHDAFKLRQAVAAFANTAGGWILVGVENGNILPDGQRDWLEVANSAPSFADAIRDRVRTWIDPLPAFEARTIPDHPNGPVGVIRVYESSDTPHVMVDNGAVYVRDVAGVRDATSPKKSGAGAGAERRYQAVKIGSRTELLALADRSHDATRRVSQLVETSAAFPLVADQLGLRMGRDASGNVTPHHDDGAFVFVRLAPYTVSPRFRGWATTRQAAEAVRDAAAEFAGEKADAIELVVPDPAGAAVQLTASAPHGSSFNTVTADARVLIDGAGLTAAAFVLGAPAPGRNRERLSLETVATKIVAPPIRAAAKVLLDGGFIGRARCQIDIVGLGNVLLLDRQGDQHQPGVWAPTTLDITLPADDSDLSATASRAASAYARSARLKAWDSHA
jgi:Putative DNA-binding domain